ncbi:MAG: hypothetical protein H6623_02400 [Bdellovibrionaceae bacterium]|nr:hypothetical protein [Pseudobdellovibrionaceae bacterium]
MQQLVQELQKMIKNYYGFSSAMEVKSCFTYQTLQKENFSCIDDSLSIPLFEPKSKHPIALFKVFGIDPKDTALQSRLYDLVNLTLQSHINLLDELSVTESLVQYLQVELNPQKVIRLRLMGNANKISPLDPHHNSSGDIFKKPMSIESGNGFLLICPQQQLIDQLALEIHHCAGNHFFIRSDYMASTFMSSINDLLNLNHTTIYIPNIEKLSKVQQKTLSTYLLIGNPEESSVVVICGSQHSITKISALHEVDLEILKHLNVFNILRDNLNELEEQKIENIQQYAQTILGAVPNNLQTIDIKTKSYHLIPSVNDLFPTVH